MFGNHWIIAPNLVRSIQVDPLTMTVRSIGTLPIEHTVMSTTASFYLLLLKPQVFYLGWIQKQSVIQ